MALWRMLERWWRGGPAGPCGTYVLARQPDIDAKAAVKRFASARSGTGDKAWESSHPPPEERELVINVQLDPTLRARVVSQL